jgi:hypothetical protein
MNATIVKKRMCTFCEWVENSKFLSWKFSIVDVIAIAIFAMTYPHH